MGMHIGLIAIYSSADDLKHAFADLWSEYEVVASECGFSTLDAAYEWKQRHEEFVSAADWTPQRPGKQVFFLWQDGCWASLWDFTYVLPTEEDKLLDLSRPFDRAIALIVESASGTGFFRSYSGGELVRSIDYSDGELIASGEPLVEEAGVVTNAFYMDEAEQLCENLGLLSLTASPPIEHLTALCVVDHSDYRDAMPNSPSPVAGNTTSAPKPWWKFW
jgi:hypothetical protein